MHYFHNTYHSKYFRLAHAHATNGKALCNGSETWSVKWVWSSMNRYRMFFVQTSTRPPNMHLKLTKHGRFCKQNNQLPTESNNELKDNSNMFQTLPIWENYLVLFVSLGICPINYFGTRYEIYPEICLVEKYLKKIMVSRNLRQAHLLEVGLARIPGDHETLFIVRHVGLHVDNSSMKSSLGA